VKFPVQVNQVISAIMIGLGVGVIAWAVENIYVTIAAVLVIIAVIIRLVYVLINNRRDSKPPVDGGAPSDER
jgi:signal transduction histidine kinase